MLRHINCGIHAGRRLLSHVCWWRTFAGRHILLDRQMGTVWQCVGRCRVFVILKSWLILIRRLELFDSGLQTRQQHVMVCFGVLRHMVWWVLHSLIYLFTYSFFLSFVHSYIVVDYVHEVLMHLLFCCISFIHSFVHSFIYSFAYLPLIHPLTNWFIKSLIHSLSHSLSRLLIHSLSFIHLLTHSLTYYYCTYWLIN